MWTRLTLPRRPWPLSALARWRRRRDERKAEAARVEAERLARELREGQEWLGRVSRQYDAWITAGGPLRPSN